MESPKPKVHWSRWLLFAVLIFIVVFVALTLLQLAGSSELVTSFVAGVAAGLAAMVSSLLHVRTPRQAKGPRQA